MLPICAGCRLVLGPELTSWAVIEADRGAGPSTDSWHWGLASVRTSGCPPPQGPVMFQSGQRTEGEMDGREAGTGRPDSDLDTTLAPRLSSHKLPPSIRGGGCWMDLQWDGGVVG